MPSGVYKRTKLHGMRISQALKGKEYLLKKGKIPWNKEEKLHYPVWNKGTKGVCVPWNKNKFHSAKTIELIKVKRANQIMKKRSVSAKKKTSESIKLKWKDKKYAKSILLSNQSRPNIFETNALNYLNTIYDNKFKYTGDGSFMVNGRSADAYSKELNIIALFHGIYWHLKIKGLKITNKNKKIVEKVDSLPFISSGYKVIFVWEDEIGSAAQLKTKAYDLAFDLVKN